jgi:hypothetical protein
VLLSASRIMVGLHSSSQQPGIDEVTSFNLLDYFIKWATRVEIVGMNRWDFLMAISRLEVFPFQHTIEDALKEVENVKRRYLVRLFSSKGGFAI